MHLRPDSQSSEHHSVKAVGREEISTDHVDAARARRSGTKKPTGSGAKKGDHALAVHFLDVGSEQYGDSVLCQFDDVTVLIDGAHPGNFASEDARHPSIPAQIAEILKQDEAALHVTLLICTHCHLDHIGCLPNMVQNGLTADWALFVDGNLGWGKTNKDSETANVSDDVRRVAAALREEPLDPQTDAATIAQFSLDAANLETRYRTMVESLEAGESQV